MNAKYRLTNPHKALRRAILDNIILVPASALPFKAHYQKIAKSRRKGLFYYVIQKREGNRGSLKWLVTFFKSEDMG